MINRAKQRNTVQRSAGLLVMISLVTACTHVDTSLKDAYKNHGILVGVAINRTVTMDDPAVEADNAEGRTLEAVRTDAALVKAQYNQVVNENDLKWMFVHPDPGPEGYDFAPADAYVQFGLDHDLYVAGHTLVWHGQTPLWVFQSDPDAKPIIREEVTRDGRQRRRRRPAEPLATREQLLERMHDHIHAVVGRYKGKVKVWDVVNEALANGDDTEEVLRDSYWRSIIGDDFIAKAFEYAHEADPDAILRYNDYGLEDPVKRERLKKLIRQLLADGVPVHAIGTQTHINLSTTYETMDETLTDLASLGLPVHITELDVNVAERGQRNTSADIEGAAQRTGGGIADDADARQAQVYADLFRAILKHKDSVELVTFWGVNDGVSWLRRGRPLLFDAQNNPKPSFDAVIGVAAEAM